MAYKDRVLLDSILENKTASEKSKHKAENPSYEIFKSAKNTPPVLDSYSIETNAVKKSIEDYEKGIASLNSECYSEALKYFDESIILNQSEGTTYYYRGLAKLNLKLYKEAIEDFSNVIRLNPEYESAYFRRGLSKYKLGDQSGSCEDMKIALENGSMEAHHYLSKYCS